MHFFGEYSECDIVRLANFFNEKDMILSEDERVILRNMPKEYKYISRQIETSDLFLTERKGGMGKGICIFEFNHLFQFIKNGEEYSLEELLK